MDDHQHRPDPVARARDLSATIEAAAEVIESARRIPQPLLDELHGARLLRMLLPFAAGIVWIIRGFRCDRQEAKP